MPNDEQKSLPTGPKLHDKVKQWLGEQGYPTEFRAANICRRHGFRVWQGFHVRDSKTETPREIDVIASADYRSSNYIVRIEHALECKWSKDKPWIVFTDAGGPMGSTACAAQTIGNMVGEAAIWTVAGNADLHSLDFFYTPARPGFGGRQAFSKGLDLFYSAVAAASELSILLATRGDRKTKPATMGQLGILVFPVVVVEGQLYEAYFDEKENDIQLIERKRIRCHWRGASSRQFITTIDIVTLDHLDEFIAARAKEMKILHSVLYDTILNIEACFKMQSLQPLKVSSGARGVIGLPDLFHDLAELDAVKANKKNARKKLISKKKEKSP